MSSGSPVAVGCVRGGPPGRTWLAASADGVVRVQLGGGRDRMLAELDRAGYVPGGRRAWLEAGLCQLEEYYRGRRRRFDLSVVSPPATPFAVRVTRELCRVPYGTTRTYGQLAARSGHAGAARAVGRVMASNPLPIIVPCHRVVAAAGLGGFGGGLAMKKSLLRLEGASF